MTFSFFSRLFKIKKSSIKMSRKRAYSESSMDTQDDSFDGNHSIVDSSSKDEPVSSYQEKVNRYETEESQNTATTLNNLGVSLQRSALKKINNKFDAKNGNINETASAAYHASLKINMKQFGLSHPSVAITLNNLGSVFFSEGYYHRALKYYNKSLDIMTKHLGPHNVNVATVWNNIGDAYRAMRKNTFALICFERALSIRQEYFGEDNILVKRLHEKINVIVCEKELSVLRRQIDQDIAHIDNIEEEFTREIEILFSQI